MDVPELIPMDDYNPKKVTHHFVVFLVPVTAIFPCVNIGESNCQNGSLADM